MTSQQPKRRRGLLDCRCAVQRFIREEDGTTAIEYAVMAALIAATCVASVAVLASATEGSFTDSASAIGN